MDVWEQVLPWICPHDLAILACTSSRLRRAVAAITRHRLADTAQGLEPSPVPILNSSSYPYFHYTPFCRSAESFSYRFPWGSPPTPAPHPSGLRRVCEDDSWRGLLLGRGLQDAGCCCSDCGSETLDIEDHFSDTDNGESTTRKMLDPSAIPLESFFGPYKYLKSLSNGRSVEHLRLATQMKGVLKTTVNHVKSSDSHASSCPCGRMSDGEFAYDEYSRLQLLTKVQEGHRQCCSESDFCIQKPCPKEKYGDAIENYVRHNQSEVTESPHGLEEGLPLIFECGVFCSCDSSCRFRVSQRGLVVPVFVKRHHLKGWSLYAGKPIEKGTFVCEYAGELVTIAESRKRQKAYDSVKSRKLESGSALLILREHLPSGKVSLRVNIDATKVGNVARFINHSCDGGNLLPCLIRSAGSFFPKLGLFARKNIEELEELTFSYGSRNEGLETRSCFCKTSSCKGFLPSEGT